MKKSMVLFIILVGIVLVGCACPGYDNLQPNPYPYSASGFTPYRSPAGEVIRGGFAGAAAGAVIGAITGGRDAGLIGAGVGAVIGAGAYALSAQKTTPARVAPVYPAAGSAYNAAYQEEMLRLRQQEYYRQLEADRRQAALDARAHFYGQSYTPPVTVSPPVPRRPEYIPCPPNVPCR